MNTSEKTIDDELSSIGESLVEINKTLAVYKVLRDKPVWTGNNVADALEAFGDGPNFPEVISIFREQGNSPIHNSNEFKAGLLPNIIAVIHSYEGVVRSFESVQELHSHRLNRTY